MSDEFEQQDAEERDPNEPRQTVRRMAEDEPDIGPFYPSGMSAPEAAAAGATADLSDQELERLGKRTAARDEGDDE